MFILRRLVGLIGYKLPQIKQVRIDKQQVRIHGLAAPAFEKVAYTDKKGNEKRKLKLDDQGKAIPISDGREEVFAAWKAKELLEIEKEKEELKSVAVEENSGDLPVEAIVEELQSVTTKEHYEAVYLNVSQASMTAAWNALAQDIRDTITGLFNETQTNVCAVT
jgi:hypothetical protein